MPDNKDIIFSNMDPQLAEAYDESIDEMLEDVVCEAIKHMTAKEKLDATKYRKSAKGKKAIAKHAKKVARAGYKVDKELSKLMKKVAAFRKDESITEEFFDTVTEDEIMENMTVEEFAALDEIIEACIRHTEEACKKELEDEQIDPENGEKVEEALRHMSSSAKARAKAYRRSAKGKMALKKYARKTARAGYKVDKSRSKLMKKVAAFRNEEENFGLSESELEAFDELFCSIVEFVDPENVEGKTLKEEVEEWEIVTLEIPVPEEFKEEYIQEVAEKCDVELEFTEEGTFVVSGKYKDIECLLDELDIDDDTLEDMIVPDKSIDSEGEPIDEMTIKHMTTKEKSKAKAYRRSAKGKAAIKRHAKKVARAGYKVDKALSRKMQKVAKLRREAIEESLDESFNEISALGTLNESESTNIKNLCVESVISMLETSEQRIVEDVTSAYEAYTNSELLPEVLDKLDENYIPQIKESILDDIDSYLNIVAEEVVSELNGKNLIVQSKKSQQYESFTENLLSLIKENLQIIPEQENALDVMNKSIENLKDSLQESKIDNAKLKDQILESKKSLYIAKNTPSHLSESQKEKLMGYVEDVLYECENMTEFSKMFDEAVSEFSVKTQQTEPTKTQKVNESNDPFASFAERARLLG